MTESEILAAIDGLTPALQRAYLEQIRATVSASTIAAVERYIDDNDEPGLVAYLSLGVLAAFFEIARGIFLAGGKKPREKPPGGRMVDFDITTASAQRAIATQASSTLQQISLGQAEAIRLMMQAGTIAGQSSKQTAVDILGRYSPQTGRRSGGVIGLTGADAQAILTARSQLNSGLKAEVAKYLQRVDRDKALDGIARRAAAADKPVAPADVQRMTAAYADRKAKTRAKMLARTTGLESYNAGFNQLYVQLSQQPKAPSSITKNWRNKGDERVRNTHEILGGQVVPLAMPFTTGKGAMLMYPGDSSLGAGLDERANCRCTLSYRVVW